MEVFCITKECTLFVHNTLTVHADMHTLYLGLFFSEAWFLLGGMVFPLQKLQHGSPFLPRYLRTRSPTVYVSMWEWELTFIAQACRQLRGVLLPNIGSRVVPNKWNWGSHSNRQVPTIWRVVQICSSLQEWFWNLGLTPFNRHSLLLWWGQ